ncbi:hypothetical protein BGZ54_002868, partial [Gamsiella multidivaricata]
MSTSRSGAKICNRLISGDELERPHITKASKKQHERDGAPHIIRACGRLKRLAKRFRATLPNVDGTIWDTIQTMDNALRTQIDTYNEHAGAPVEAIAFPPTLTDKEETWTGWIRDIKKYWHDAIQFMQAERESIKRTKIKEAIDSRCDQMRGNPGKMLDSILDRHRGKVVIDR